MLIVCRTKAPRRGLTVTGSQHHRTRRVAMHEQTGHRRRPMPLWLAMAEMHSAVETESEVKKCSLTAIGKVSTPASRIQEEVYDHLYKFFRRYYHEGDFLAKRVYKPGVYAIPYEGEEVKLYWANKEQYYIKTSEYLRDYAFTLKPGAEDPMRVHFRLVDAAEGEHDNVKEAQGNNRVFILAGEDFIAEEEGESGCELVIRFEFRPATMDDWSEDARANATAAAKKKPPTQKDLRADAVRRLLAVEDGSLKPWLDELAKHHVKADGEQADYSRLAAHLNRYTARNTFDYFIHKDLGGFLRRELDFYIKNEVMHLDDIESETAPRVEQYLSKIKVIRQIASKIIDFLAQLENFQKKLWLKKKFVTETSYCIRLGIIPEEFYSEIATNDAQRREWVELHAIDELEADLTTVAYSEPLTAEFLKAHPTLMVDTRHFDHSFSQRLLEVVGRIDSQTDFFLFHGDNFQVLSAIKKKEEKSIDCIYIDPPYNTEQDRESGRFVYKDSYEHSSWLSMMNDRFSVEESLLSDTGAHFVSSDESELHRLISLVESYGRKYHGLFTWRRTRTGGHLSRAFNQLSDYIVVSTAAGGSYLFGGMADPEESQPLTKSTNRRADLVFPEGTLEFLDLDEGGLELGHSGTSANPVVSKSHVKIRNFFNENEVTLEGPFVWTQGKLDSELDSGARIIIKKHSSFNPRFLRQPDRHKPFLNP